MPVTRSIRAIDKTKTLSHRVPGVRLPDLGCAQEPFQGSEGPAGRECALLTSSYALLLVRVPLPPKNTTETTTEGRGWPDVGKREIRLLFRTL